MVNLKMHNEIKAKLLEYFDQARHAAPEWTKDASPLNYGSFGLTLSYPDNSIRKLLFFHPDHPFTQTLAEDGFQRETQTLQILSGSAAAGFVPELLEEPQTLDPESGFFGSYKMSRLKGYTPTWREDKIAETLEKHDFKKMAASAGNLLARFHCAVQECTSIRPPSATMEHHYGHDIKTIAVLGDDLNTRLEHVNAYLQQRKIIGSIHGDFHGNNIVVDKNGVATGLIDFARTASNGNIYYDFASVPSDYIHDFVQGYKSVKDIDFDKRLMIATSLSAFTNYMSDLVSRGEAQEAEGFRNDVERRLEEFDHPDIRF